MSNQDIFQQDFDDWVKTTMDTPDPTRLAYLSNEWKENPKYILIWPHSRSRPMRIRRLTFPTFRTKKNDRDETIKFVSWTRYASPDPETIHLGSRRKSDSSTFSYSDRFGNCKYPPVLDPALKLELWLFEQVAAGNIDMKDTVFAWNWAAKDGKMKEIEWKAGKLSGYEKGDSKDFGVTLRAAADSVIQIVDDNDVGKGLQVGFFTSMLLASGTIRGDNGPLPNYKEGKLMVQIQAAMQYAKDTMGDANMGKLSHNPYPFRIEYKKTAAAPTDKYVVEHCLKDLRLKDVNLTPEIRELIVDREPYDLTHLYTPTADDAAMLYNAMKEAAQIDLPLDELFQPWMDSFDHSIKSDATPETTKTVRVMPVYGAETTLEIGSLDACASCEFLVHPEWNRCPNCDSEFMANEGETLHDSPPADWLRLNDWPGSDRLSDDALDGV